MELIDEAEECPLCKEVGFSSMSNDETLHSVYFCMKCGYGMKFDENLYPMFARSNFSTDFYLRLALADTYLNPFTFMLKIKDKNYLIKPSKESVISVDGKDIPMWVTKELNKDNTKESKVIGKEVPSFKAAIELAKNGTGKAWAVINDKVMVVV